MPGWLAGTLERLVSEPVLQATLAGLATLVLEDPTTITCGLLVADGLMAFPTALAGVAVGIAAGDVGLYGIGRGIGPRLIARGWIDARRVERASAWFRKNLVGAMVLSRFVPGMRLPTYVAAGVLRAPFWSFMTIASIASLVWTFLLLRLTVELGEAVLPLLGRWRWPVALAILAGLVLLHRRAAKALRRTEAEEDRDDGPIASVFEFWPPWLFYVPVAMYWVWLSVRFRGVLLPTAANPRIPTGGLIGESKSEILDLVAPEDHRWLAPYVAVEMLGNARDRLDRAHRALARAGLAYPLVAKPDVGQRGAGVRPVRSDADLETYVGAFPEGERLVLQRLAGHDPEAGSAPVGPFPGGVAEAGVLYWRRPDVDRGEIFSITLKRFPAVRGDGRRTLRRLIEDDPRARRIRDVYCRRHAEHLDRVLPEGEEFALVFSGNHCQGAVFLDGTPLATPALLARIDGIARRMPEFHFGRFDVRFDDFEAFLRGEDLQIVEINGAGAEATHIWDAKVHLTGAYSTLFRQFRMLFWLGAENRRRGFRPTPIGRFLKDLASYHRTARSYPMTR